MIGTKNFFNALKETRTRNPNNRVFIITIKSRLSTYDGMLDAPMSLMTLLLVMTAVRAFFAIGSAAFGMLVGVVV